MYIGEVIRRVQSYCPSEYDTNEMYLWCDEVSSMLAIEDRNIFVKEILKPDKEGRVLLPQGVGFENVISVTSEGRELKKEDLRNQNTNMVSSAPIEVIYLKPYSPIRTVTYNGDIGVDKEKSQLMIGADIFKTGDVITVEIGGVSKELQVFGATFNGDGFVVDVSDVEGLPDSGAGSVSRVVTDKTVCDAPYDGMYVDYIIAKICMYQRDFDTYNQFMTSFNSRLLAYKKWITNQLPQAGGKLKNWW
ncbi:MAG: hypothetical protein IJC09_08130 [Clostridia bacterium]|nr:hypothetical protein [Clostridia bacterium]